MDADERSAALVAGVMLAAEVDWFLWISSAAGTSDLSHL